jgi:hypothetical protein
MQERTTLSLPSLAASRSCDNEQPSIMIEECRGR